ncbi:ABC transporter ATP-binding protein [Desulfobacterota bacterium AH_259_B03_O07]|nr:ABC transporter ATP-binding protein [Desulfobacterota bacterium AH_259_B03_O07]
MGNIAIRVEDLSKQYRIGKKIGRYNTLRDSLTKAFFSSFHSLEMVLRGQSTSISDYDDKIWALKDVSFEVKQGEVIGVIGRNGAGKTTLFKILSRITEPTHGYAEIKGRVGSLLEVGTGFHPELTGRENIYLNGAILGMKREEINRKFDEIVAFAEIEKFIDTPVKHYSSGMYVRLAFAVAAHLDPEILLIDEVLAVGDIDFQRKCIGSMQSVTKSGRTVLIVSHNMALIETLCTNAIWLHDGEIQSCGQTQDVLAHYLTKSQLLDLENISDRSHRRLNTTAQFLSIQILNAHGEHSRIVKMGCGITLRLKIFSEHPIQSPWIGIQIRTPFNQLLFHIANIEAGYELKPIQGECIVSCHIEKLNLLPDRYFLDLILADKSNKVYDKVSHATYFDVRPSDVFNTSMPMGKEYGLVFLATRWESNRED